MVQHPHAFDTALTWRVGLVTWQWHAAYAAGWALRT